MTSSAPPPSKKAARPSPSHNLCSPSRIFKSSFVIVPPSPTLHPVSLTSPPPYTPSQLLGLAGLDPSPEIDRVDVLLRHANGLELLWSYPPPSEITARAGDAVKDGKELGLGWRCAGVEGKVVDVGEG
eukprot:CAMPEP_0182464198 /NCGR_PEP_ID=MMETSP1319-20130603/8384_1 /TAXON_ID=172717 /ORGANISM="Bolidomonas pacifica, Strain RCC208" /LENGTH=127 /DNA_ID=CAMNT_0024663825 /DNA_START=202 /DNA_END=582 /DNA_ORIENTATION=-